MMPSASEIGEAPDHHILDEPWTYEIVAVHYLRGDGVRDSPTLDLTLRRDGIVCHLRFDGVRGLRLGRGFEWDYIGLQIIDVHKRGWEDINVWVGCFEGDYIEFWSRSVSIRNEPAA